MIKCGGVLVPDGYGWRRACFVDERGLATALADVIWQDGKRPLQPSEDHYWPESHWPGSTRMHTVHLYCQAVQGGLIAGPMLAEWYLTSPGQVQQFEALRLASTAGRTPEADVKRSDSMKRWATTEDGQAHIANASVAAHLPQPWANTIRSLKAYAATRAGSEKISRASAKGSCQHWQINRDKPCVCGQHV